MSSHLITDRVSTGGKAIASVRPSVRFHSIFQTEWTLVLDLLHVCESLPWLAGNWNFKSQVRFGVRVKTRSVWPLFSIEDRFPVSIWTRCSVRRPSQTREHDLLLCCDWSRPRRTARSIALRRAQFRWDEMRWDEMNPHFRLLSSASHVSSVYTGLMVTSMSVSRTTTTLDAQSLQQLLVLHAVHQSLVNNSSSGNNKLATFWRKSPAKSRMKLQ